VDLLVQKMTELQKEKHELFLWAKEQQQRHLQEIRKLTRALGRTKRGVEEQVRLPSSAEWTLLRCITQPDFS
jgi:predicted transcriptional regulator